MTDYMQFDPSKLTDSQALDLQLRAEKYRAEVKEQAQLDAELEKYRRQQADADAAKEAADQRAAAEKLANDKRSLIRPDSFEAYSTFDAATKACYIQAFGSGFVADLRSKERFGMTWDAYDRVSAEIAARKEARQNPTPAEQQGSNYFDQREKYRASNKSLLDALQADEKRAARVRFGLPPEE